uniref:hypothetical protein n=1 Tax=Nocardia asiatica TaxID=209252 RepID=UPI0024576AF0
MTGYLPWGGGGGWGGGARAPRAKARQQSRGTVRFAEGIRSVAEFGVDAYLEVGPHPVLLEFGRR